MARYTVKYAAGERRGSLLVLLPPTKPCPALIDAVKTRFSSDKTPPELNNLQHLDASLHLEESNGPMLYSEDRRSDVLSDATEIVVVVFQVSKVSRVVLGVADWRATLNAIKLFFALLMASGLVSCCPRLTRFVQVPTTQKSQT
jgi:hypothetical protein